MLFCGGRDSRGFSACWVPRRDAAAGTMSSPEEQANLGRALDFLRRWDRGDGPVRVRLLRSFLNRNARKTFYELEVDLAQTASLLLARITVWMRVSYPAGFAVSAAADGDVCLLLESRRLSSVRTSFTGLLYLTMSALNVKTARKSSTSFLKIV